MVAARATRPLLYTEDPTGGTNRVYLDKLRPGPSVVTGLKWTTTYPGGDTSATANLSTLPDLVHSGLALGRKAVIVSGGGIRWQGRIDQAKRGQPWSLSMSGLASLVINSTSHGGFVAVDSGGNAYNLNNVIDQAIIRGLPFTRPASLPTAGTAASGSCDIDTALANVGKALGQVWSLSPLGAITMAVPPTTPSYVLQSAQALTPAVAGFTQGVSYYADSTTTTATTTTSNATAVTKWGPIEGRYDMTGLGVLGSGTAATYLANWLAVNLAAPTYTDTITVQYGQLRAITGSSANQFGGPVDLATVRAGCLVTVFDVDPDHSHLLAPGPLQVLVGQTEYDADADTLTLTPIGAVGEDLFAVIYQALNGAI